MGGIVDLQNIAKIYIFFKLFLYSSMKVPNSRLQMIRANKYLCNEFFMEMS